MKKLGFRAKTGAVGSLRAETGPRFLLSFLKGATCGLQGPASGPLGFAFCIVDTAGAKNKMYTGGVYVCKKKVLLGQP